VSPRNQRYTLYREKYKRSYRKKGINKPNIF
jgi:hypothetical protein